MSSVPISVYRITCHQFPSLYIVSPSISSRLCVSYRLLSVPISYIVSPDFSSHLCITYRLPLVFISEYIIVCLQCTSPYFVSPAINQFPSLISYRLQSLPISVCRIACHHFPTPYFVPPTNTYHLCISYRLPLISSLILNSLPSAPISV